VSEATGAAHNQGRARVTERGGTSGSGAKPSTTVQPNSGANNDATTEVPAVAEAQDAAPPQAPATEQPPSVPGPATGGSAPGGPPPAGADPPRDAPWEQRPPEPDMAPPSAQWTSTVQPSGTAVNRSSSPYGPYGGPSEAPPQQQPPPPPPVGAPPPSGLRGRAAVTRARAGKRAAAAGKTTTGKAPRRAHLQVSRFEPWSVMKFSFVMSLVCFVVLLVAVTVLYMILSGLGVFESISSTINDLTREQGAKSGGLDAASWFSFARVFGYTALIGSLNVLLITALATVWAVIYNLAADFVGGVEVTLKEAE
jgi:hypothetical protein